MKKDLLSYILYTVYLLALIKPMFPVLNYMVNYNYISSQLCKNIDKPTLNCNGKCYVAKEIKSSDKNHSDHSLMPQMELEKYTTKIFFINFEPQIIEFNTNSIKFYYLEKNNKEFLSTIFRPPIVS